MTIFVTDTLEDDDVGVHRHAYREQYARDAGESELHPREHGAEPHQQDDVDGKRDVRGKPQTSVHHRHEDEDEPDTHRTRDERHTHCVVAESRGDVAHLAHAQRHAECARLQTGGKLAGCGIVVRPLLAGDDGVAVRDVSLHADGREEGAVDVDVDILEAAVVRIGEVGKRLGALAVEAESDHAFTVLIEGGVGGLEIAAVKGDLGIGGKRGAYTALRRGSHELQLCGTADEVEHVFRVVDVGHFDADGIAAAALRPCDGCLGIALLQKHLLQGEDGAVHARGKIPLAAVVFHVEHRRDAAREVETELDRRCIAVIIVHRARHGEGHECEHRHQDDEHGDHGQDHDRFFQIHVAYSCAEAQ